MFFRNKEKEELNLENELLLKKLIEIPFLTDYGTTKSELITDYKSMSSISIAFKDLKTNIQFLNINNNDKNSFLIASPSNKEGKSFVASNLAIAFAQIDKKVILIDADLNTGRLANIFGIPNNLGLSNYLSGLNDLGIEIDYNISRFINNTRFENINIITSGTIPPNSAEILSSPKLPELIEELSLEYDIIIFDGTSVLNVADSLILSRIINSTVLVINSNSIHIEELKKSIKDIQNIGGRILGFVLNNKEANNKKLSNYLTIPFKKIHGFFKTIRKKLKSFFKKNEIKLLEEGRTDVIFREKRKATSNNNDLTVDEKETIKPVIVLRAIKHKIENNNNKEKNKKEEVKKIRSNLKKDENILEVIEINEEITSKNNKTISENSENYNVTKKDKNDYEDVNNKSSLESTIIKSTENFKELQNNNKQEAIKKAEKTDLKNNKSLKTKKESMHDKTANDFNNNIEIKETDKNNSLSKSDEIKKSKDLDNNRIKKEQDKNKTDNNNSNEDSIKSTDVEENKSKSKSKKFYNNLLEKIRINKNQKERIDIINESNNATDLSNNSKNEESYNSANKDMNNNIKNEDLSTNNKKQEDSGAEKNNTTKKIKKDSKKNINDNATKNTKGTKADNTVNKEIDLNSTLVIVDAGCGVCRVFNKNCYTERLVRGLDNKDGFVKAHYSSFFIKRRIEGLMALYNITKKQAKRIDPLVFETLCDFDEFIWKEKKIDSDAAGSYVKCMSLDFEKLPLENNRTYNERCRFLRLEKLKKQNLEIEYYFDSSINISNTTVLDKIKMKQFADILGNEKNSLKENETLNTIVKEDAERRKAEELVSKQQEIEIKLEEKRKKEELRKEKKKETAVLRKIKKEKDEVRRKELKAIRDKKRKERNKIREENKRIREIERQKQKEEARIEEELLIDNLYPKTKNNKDI